MESTISKKSRQSCRRRTLAGTLNLWLSIIVTVIITLLGMLYFFIAANQAQHDLSQQATQTVEALADVLSAPAWSFDKYTIRQIAVSYQAFRGVAAINVFDDTGGILYESVSTEQGLIFETRPIEYYGRRVGVVNLSISTEPIAKLRRGIFFQVFAVVVTVIITIQIATWLLLQSFLGTPLAETTKGIEEFAGGNYSLRLKPLAQHELNLISEQFNAMADQIQMRDRFLEQRILDRTAQLQASNQELEAFAYSVSHDLRGPLRGMEGFSAALLSDYRDKLDEQGQHYLDRIQQASQRMGQLINDLLNLSRITRSELNSQSMDLGSLAREIAAELQALDPQREAEFVIAEALIVRGDAHLLRAALQNLLGNAWKFSGTRQKAVIEVGQMTVSDFKLQNENWASRLSQSEISNPQSIIYYVRDNGVGFDMDHAAKLFAPFQRLHAMNEFPGTGIGLAIVQRVIARHGGRIWPYAQVEQGATFYFTLGGLS